MSTDRRERQTDRGFSLSGHTTPLRVLVADTWRHRELIVLLARKEFFVRYRRASFGAAWAVVLPLVQAFVLSVVVGRFVAFDLVGNFALFVFSGVLVWTFFSSSISAGTGAIVDNVEMSSKIYFPRAIFALTVVGSGLYGLVISSGIAVVFSIVVGETDGVEVLLLAPALVLVTLLSAAGALLLSALQVYFRDMKYLVQALLLPLFYVTPIFYPLDAVDRLRPFLEANPMTGIVELMQIALTETDAYWPRSLGWTMVWIVVVAAAAATAHRRQDRVMSDLL